MGVLSQRQFKIYPRHPDGFQTILVLQAAANYINLSVVRHYEMQPSSRTYHPDELVGRQNAKGLLILAIPITIGFLVNAFNFTEGYKRSAVGAIFLTGVLFVLSVYFWYKIFDSGTKLIINRHGIWTRKYKTLPWDTIEAYHFERRLGKTVTSILWVESTIIGQSYSLEITYLDRGYDDISNAIEINSNNFDIRYSGINEIEY
jgi:hypothetical protein